jgi:hypothetical protein
MLTSNRSGSGGDDIRSSKWFSIAAVVTFVCTGLYIASDSRGVEATTWMNIFAFSDLATPDKIGDFVANLIIPVPIALSLFEIAVYKTFGSTYLVTHVLYRGCLVLSYVLAIYLCSESRNRFLFCIFTSLVFVWCTILIHPGNPQLYDFVFPLWNLVFVIALKSVKTDETSTEATALPLLLCAAAGFSLSMVELLRPFVFLVMPFLLFCVYLRLRRLPRKYFAAFIVPVLLFSGSWHGYQAVRHGQIVWSNHSGFNLVRAWPMVESPVLVPESNNQPLAPDRLPNLNTREHLENSRRLQKGIVEFLITHPLEGLANIGYRFYVFMTVPTHLSMNNPPYPELWLYRILVWIACLILLRGLVLLGYHVVSSRRLDRLGDPENILSSSALLYMMLMAVGDAGEESRFWISILPILAAQFWRLDTNSDGLPLRRLVGALRLEWAKLTGSEPHQ